MHLISFTWGLSGGLTPYKYPAICTNKSKLYINKANIQDQSTHAVVVMLVSFG